MKSFTVSFTLVWLTLTAQWGAAQEVVSSAAVQFAERHTDAIPDFQKHVVPLLGRLGCNSAKCHGSFQGQAGFRLSLFGFDFQADHSAIRAEASSMQENRIRTEDPEESLIILKPTEQTDHAGGRRFELNSWEHHLLLRWIESGAIGSESRNTDPLPQVNQTKSSPEGMDLFKKKIQPLFENHCYECHGFNNRKGGLQVKTRDMLLQGGSSGSAIVPGNPEESLLIQAVRYSSDALQMPPSGKLDPMQISDLENWVRMRAPWPADQITAALGPPNQKLVKLHYKPAEILFHAVGDTLQIQVIAEWENGEREDVTCLARFQTNNDAVVEVDRDGLATSTGEGDTHLVVFYDNGVASIPVLRPYRSSDNLSSVIHRDSDEVPSRGSVHPIDRYVDAKLSKLGLIASARSSDVEFLRRVSIDMTGTLPIPQEVIAFLTDQSSDKRIRKINELLDRSTYAAWWSNKLCDFTGCSPASIQSLLEVASEEGYVKASQWYEWIYRRVAANIPYDDLVEGIMLADLSSQETDGMPYFWTRQSLEKPKDTAMSVAHSFLGIQLQCAECHKHPFDQWTQTDFNDFSQFFETITRSKRDVSIKEEKNLNLLRSQIVSLGPDDDPRRPIMDWMRDRNNPWFARAFVNRVWAGYFHVGIVDPPDQFTPANPPSNPELLDWLTDSFVENGYDMKWLHRQIAGSETYQRSWKPNDTNRNDRRNFSRAIPRRIPAEVIYDAMKQVTAAADELDEVRTNLRRRASGHLSMRMAGTHAMKVFGKPDRAINCDCERVNAPTLLQAVFVQNDPLVRMRLAESSWISEMEQRVESGASFDKRELIRQVWLRTVNRLPADEEVARSVKHLNLTDSLTEGLSDLMWAMINTKEFLLNH